ncbi:MAG: hypothetical protein CFE45_00780 [Burkholderiales bacterium PBB5]|nr:MAG: hypothetical protein CFE45_00780 [Burkholderiales bacterium PBB5]
MTTLFCDTPPLAVPGPATRTEHDSFGAIEVPAQALWAAQTERSRRLFVIGHQRMPLAVVHALAQVKRAAAEVNGTLGLLDPLKARAIADAAAAVAAGEFDEAFPLSVWQTGSGTQSHMNVNEVLANLASLALGGTLGVDRRVHPNDDVNRGQSSNDVFPTAMHVAVVQASRPLLLALCRLRSALLHRARVFATVLKVGRTHGQDATPITLGQEFGGYAAQLALAEASLRQALPAVHALAIGGTAVGTGLNTHPAFGPRVAAVLSRRLGQPFVVAPNLFAALAGHEPLVALHGALRGLAVALTKIANDIRWMGSGPRAGLGELRLPANEPGSSTMPGKVNPTQVEALTMVCVQVMGHDVAIGLAASAGQFELNVYKPLIALDVLDSLNLLADAMASFAVHCVDGIEADEAHCAELLQRSLMPVTALTPHIGYDRAARIAHQAHAQGSSLRAAALAEGGVTAAEFDAWVQPAAMVGLPGLALPAAEAGPPPAGLGYPAYASHPSAPADLPPAYPGPVPAREVPGAPVSAETLSTSFGAFKPVGHLMVGLPAQAQALSLVAALWAAGWPTAAVQHLRPTESVAELAALVDQAGPMAGFGYEITLLRRYLALAQQGYCWLLVKVDDVAQAAQAIDTYSRQVDPARRDETYALLWSNVASGVDGNVFRQATAAWPRIRSGFTSLAARLKQPYFKNGLAYLACLAQDRDTARAGMAAIGEPDLDAWQGGGAGGQQNHEACTLWLRSAR